MAKEVPTAYSNVELWKRYGVELFDFRMVLDQSKESTNGSAFPILANPFKYSIKLL
jgi:hypothetical protein